MRTFRACLFLALCSGCAAPGESGTVAPATITGGEHNLIAPGASGTLLTLKPPPPHLVYWGGRVLSNVEVVAVFWGSGVNSSVSSGIGSFYSAVTNNIYMDWLSEYDTPTQTIGRGKLKGNFTIAPGNTKTSLSDAEIQAELIAQIDTGALPPPNANTSYMVHFPPGFTITDSTGARSCQQFCAYHNAGSFPGHCRTTWVCPPPRCTTLGCLPQPCYPTTTCDPAATFAYSVLPDLGDAGCNTGCGTNTQFNNQTSTASHELIESVTDPGFTMGWRDLVDGEIGDICNQSQATLPGTGFTVQKEWSNHANACIVSTCTPSCAGKCGGDDGCGGTCPNNCLPGLGCYHDACCLPNCAGKCGGDDGCGGVCPNSCLPGLSCYHDACCLPSCVGKCGGDDGCGGVCPACCVPNCFGKLGGPDGCGGTCPF